MFLETNKINGDDFYLQFFTKTLFVVYAKKKIMSLKFFLLSETCNEQLRSSKCNNTQTKHFIYVQSVTAKFTNFLFSRFKTRILQALQVLFSL